MAYLWVSDRLPLWAWRWCLRRRPRSAGHPVATRSWLVSRPYARTTATTSGGRSRGPSFPCPPTRTDCTRGTRTYRRPGPWCPWPLACKGRPRSDKRTCWTTGAAASSHASTSRSAPVTLWRGEMKINRMKTKQQKITR